MRKYFLLIMLWGISLIARPQEMLPVWANSIGGPSWDMAKTMCITPDGNIIVAGSFSDSIAINGEWHYSEGMNDVYVAKYNSDGKQLGAFCFGGTADDFALLSGYDNNFVLLTKFYVPFDVQGSKVDSTGLVNYLAGWFDEKGTLVNSKTFSCTADIRVSDMKTDGNGTIYLTGWYSDTLRIDGTIQNIAKTETPLLLSLQKNGKAHSLQQVKGMDNQRVYACAIDNGNTMLVAGTTTGNTDKDAINPDITYQTLFTATVNNGGKASGQQNIIRGVELQPVSVVKARECTWVASSFKYYCLNGADTIFSKGQNDILLAKIPNKKGETQLWTIGGYANDLPLSLSVSGEQAILSGSYADTIWFGADNFMVANEMGSDLFLAVFEDEKTPVKTVSLGGLYNDFPCAVSTSDAGVYVLGQFKTDLAAGNVKLETQGSYDVFTARFENCGAKQPVEIFATASKNTKGGVEYQLTVDDGYVSYKWGDGLGYGQTATTGKTKEYTVEAIDAFGCTCTGEINLVSLKSALLTEGETKISNAQQAEFKLYPTVTEAIVYWQPGSSFPAAGATLTVYDAKGSAIISKVYATNPGPLSVQTLDLGRLVPGQYLVDITGNGFNKSTKVIVK